MLINIRFKMSGKTITKWFEGLETQQYANMLIPTLTYFQTKISFL